MDQSLSCAVPRGAWQRAGSTLCLDHSLACALPRGARQRVLPFPCVLGGARQRGCDAVSPRTTVNTFYLQCVTYYARQQTVTCVAFFQNARQSSLPGKNESDALCRALGKNAHGKGGAVRIPPFAVRRGHTTKSAIPVVSCPSPAADRTGVRRRRRAPTFAPLFHLPCDELQPRPQGVDGSTTPSSLPRWEPWRDLGGGGAPLLTAPWPADAAAGETAGGGAAARRSTGPAGLPSSSPSTRSSLPPPAPDWRALAPLPFCSAGAPRRPCRGQP
jgi:hypothetical protein